VELLTLVNVELGDEITVDGDKLCCLESGAILTVEEDQFGLFFKCQDGRHYLADFADPERGYALVGLSRRRPS
jgi:hypothetical protein